MTSSPKKRMAPREPDLEAIKVQTTNEVFNNTTTLPQPSPAADLIATWAARWPLCFSVREDDRRPLKVGISHDLYCFTDLTHDQISKALYAYVGVASYLGRLTAGADRVDLDGEPVGKVTKDQQRGAEERIKLLSGPVWVDRPEG
jgi:ProP effector